MLGDGLLPALLVDFVLIEGEEGGEMLLFA